MRILVTAFDPFGGESVNPALEAVKKLPDTILGAEIIKQELPTVFTRSIHVLEKAIDEIKPDVVLSVGQAGGRFDITVEKVAINLQDASIPDNDNEQPLDEKVFEDGENAYFATIPVKRIVERINKKGIPASISYTAGTYVCNNIMYAGLYFIEKKHLNIKGGFIHVPFIPQQAVGKRNTASMSLNDIASALEEAIKAIIENNEDIKEIGGATH